MAKQSANKKSQAEINQEKKARVMGQNQGSSRTGLILAAAVVLVLAGGAAWWASGGGGSAPTATVAPVASADRGQSGAQGQAQEQAKDQPQGQAQAAAGAPSQASVQAVVIPAAQFDDHQARHYSHKTPDGLTVRFFVLKSSDGVIRAAFDACDVCWPANKGYTQDGDVMICNNCGRRFASVRINEVKGGCNPAPLVRTIQDGQVVIQIKDIMAGRTYFDFSQQKG